jgi:polyhydroxyalkanoate synthase
MAKEAHRKETKLATKEKIPSFQDVGQNLWEIGTHAQNLSQHYIERAQQGQWPESPFNPLAFQEALWKAAKDIGSHPEKIHQANQTFFQDVLALSVNTYKALLQKDHSQETVISPLQEDKRFQNDSWSSNPYFDYVKQAYLLWDRWIDDLVHSAEDLDSLTKHQVEFISKRFTAAFSPNNFMHLNPEVLKHTMETGGMNLVTGLKNFLHDMTQGQGVLDITMVDKSAFKLGENLATTPGHVVFQNELIQLIQYLPTQGQVHKIPVLLVPPCINKYYIFDLKAENSFIKWLIDQGFTVFVISWVNPDARLAHKTFEEYALQGVKESVEAIRAITQSPKVNAVGFCIGGSILSFYSAYAAYKKEDFLSSLTFLATPFDCSQIGDLQVFITEKQLNDLEKNLKKTGYFDGSVLAKAFNLLRSNDLIWSFVINNYLMGKNPAAFDILYWNSDTTRLPAAMYIYYLKNIFLRNLLMKPGALQVQGCPLDLSKIQVPSYVLNTHRDHIVPWECGYKGAQLFSGPTTFVLGGSGHVAGIFNHPHAQKYCYWTHDQLKGPEQDWFKHANVYEGSWWPHWCAWLKDHSGPLNAPPRVGSKKYPVLDLAPGSYVRE